MIFTTSQPFFADTGNYRKLDYNKYGISYFYQTSSGRLPHTVIPDASTDILFCCSPNDPMVDICGQVITPSKALGKKNSLYFGVNFFINFNLFFADILSGKDLLNNKVPIDVLFKDNDSYKKIFETTRFEDQIKIFLNAYIPVFDSVASISSKAVIVENALSKIVRSKGTVPIAELCKDIGYSERYLNFLFHNYFGTSAKTAENIIRFQSALNQIDNMPQELDFADISLNLGYYDQSHLIHDFNKYLGMTPRKYRKYIAKLNN